MRLDLICVLLAAACLCFITPAAAVDMQLPALPQTQTIVSPTTIKGCIFHTSSKNVATLLNSGKISKTIASKY